MNLIELVEMRKLGSRKVGLVRHTTSKEFQGHNFDEMYFNNPENLEFYQSIQDLKSYIFDKFDYIICFIGIEGTKSLYIGTYKVLGYKPAQNVVPPKSFPLKDFITDKSVHYDLRKTDFMEDLIERLVIDWGNPAINWCKNLYNKSEKEVVEIRPKGYVENFPGYDAVFLSFIELEKIIRNPDANRIWHTMLSAVAGIYLIVDRKNGLQYLGSAYGKKGIWGRWKNYVADKHGGNIKLKENIAINSKCYENYTFSILRTLPKTLTKNEVIAYENQYKEILGTRAFGLNGN